MLTRVTKMITNFDHATIASLYSNGQMTLIQGMPFFITGYHPRVNGIITFEQRILIISPPFITQQVFKFVMFSKYPL